MDNNVMTLQVPFTFFFVESLLSRISQITIERCIFSQNTVSRILTAELISDIHINIGQCVTLKTDGLIKEIRPLKFSCIMFTVMFAGCFVEKTLLGVSQCLQGKLYVVRLGKYHLPLSGLSFKTPHSSQITITYFM